MFLRRLALRHTNRTKDSALIWVTYQEALDLAKAHEETLPFLGHLDNWYVKLQQPDCSEVIKKLGKHAIRGADWRRALARAAIGHAAPDDQEDIRFIINWMTRHPPDDMKYIVWTGVVFLMAAAGFGAAAVYAQQKQASVSSLLYFSVLGAICGLAAGIFYAEPLSRPIVRRRDKETNLEFAVLWGLKENVLKKAPEEFHKAFVAHLRDLQELEIQIGAAGKDGSPLASCAGFLENDLCAVSRVAWENMDFDRIAKEINAQQPKSTKTTKKLAIDFVRNFAADNEAGIEAAKLLALQPTVANAQLINCLTRDFVGTGRQIWSLILGNRADNPVIKHFSQTEISTASPDELHLIA